jgi:4-amino-4-deoxy-L-arabinose transferase-like glycosyltransferase
MNIPRNNKQLQTALALALLLVVAFFALFEPSFTASDLTIAPDSVEYSTAAWRLVHEGRYAVTINGTAYPPRYPPGFALLALAPVYQLLGHEIGIGAGIFGVLFWSLVGVAAAFAIGRRLGGIPSGLMAGAAVLLLPDFRRYSQMIMSDTTCAAMMLVLLLAYLRLTSADNNWRGWLTAGVISALAVAIRPTALSATLPFLLLVFHASPHRRSLSNSILFALPILFFAASQMLYNFRVFGSPLRSGYQYWCPVPYDYPHLTFGISHLSSNAEAAWQSGLFILPAIVTFFFFVLRRSVKTDDPHLTTRQDSLRFVLLTAAPLAVFHLFYFYPETRFFLPATGLFAAVAGAQLGTLIQRVSDRSAVVAAAAALVLVLLVALTRPTPDPTRRTAVDLFNNTLPRSALLISSIDPVYLDFFFNRNAERTVLPLSRHVEYASKIVAPTKVREPDPPPAHAFDHRCPGIRNGGGHDVISATASEPEGLDLIDATLTAGTPVFLDATHISWLQQSTVAYLQNRYQLRRQAEGLYELTQPPYRLR